jgi:quercetin dioxygenase-like cupin family protein
VSDISNLRPYHRVADQNSTVPYYEGSATLLARGEDTGGRFALCVNEVTRGNEPHPHIHEREDEFYYVLDGEIEAYCGAEVYQVRAGEIVFLPHGMPRTFNCVTQSARILVQATAAAGESVTADRFLLAMAALWADLGDAAPDPAVFQEKILQIAAAHHVSPVPPNEFEKLMPHYPGPGNGPKSQSLSG